MPGERFRVPGHETGYQTMLGQRHLAQNIGHSIGDPIARGIGAGIEGAYGQERQGREQDFRRDMAGDRRFDALRALLLSKLDPSQSESMRGLLGAQDMAGLGEAAGGIGPRQPDYDPAAWTRMYGNPAAGREAYDLSTSGMHMPGTREGKAQVQDATLAAMDQTPMNVEGNPLLPSLDRMTAGDKARSAMRGQQADFAERGSKLQALNAKQANDPSRAEMRRLQIEGAKLLNSIREASLTGGEQAATLKLVQDYLRTNEDTYNKIKLLNRSTDSPEIQAMVEMYEQAMAYYTDALQDTLGGVQPAPDETPATATSYGGIGMR